MQDTIPLTGRKRSLTIRCVVLQKRVSNLKPINPKPQLYLLYAISNKYFLWILQTILCFYEKCQNKKIPDCLSRSISYDIFSLTTQLSIRMCLKFIYNLQGSLDLKLTLIIFNTRQDISSQHYLQLLQGRITNYNKVVMSKKNSRIQIIQIKS